MLYALSMGRDTPNATYALVTFVKLIRLWTLERLLDSWVRQVI